MRAGSMPRRARYVATAWARSSDRPMLYSTVPRGSVKPTIAKLWVGLALKQLAFFCRMFFASSDSEYWSKAKYTGSTAQVGRPFVGLAYFTHRLFTQSSSSAQSVSFSQRPLRRHFPARHWPPGP